MLTPLQISTQRFTPSGKGGYKAAEVDAFIQKVYKNYAKLFNDNNTLGERLSSLSPVIDEYNQNKAAIANALISAQTVANTKLDEAKAAADEIISEATAKGDEIIREKSAEAEKYYADKTHEADVKLTELQTAYSNMKSESDSYKENYLKEVNFKVSTIIEDANNKAASIVAKAYSDAKTAREKADEVISSANAELDAIKAETAKIKNELASLIKLAESATKAVGDYEKIENSVYATEEVEAEKISAEDIPAFDFEIEAVTAVAEEPVAEGKEADEIPDESADGLFDEEEESLDLDLFSHSTPEMPDVNSYLSKIFDGTSQDDSTFGFNDLISESTDSEE